MSDQADLRGEDQLFILGAHIAGSIGFSYWMNNAGAGWFWFGAVIIVGEYVESWIKRWRKSA